MRTRALRLVATAALVLLVATPLLAQRTTGQINGTVKDEDGGILPGVTVSLEGENVVGTRTTITNESGFYRLLNLPPGYYDLEYALEGFSTQHRHEIRVSLGATTVENVTMSIGELSEAITITADAPVVDSSSSEVGSNYGRDWVENAPMQRLSFDDLVAAAPGSLRGGDQSGRTMVYGSSYDENAFQLDGVDVSDNFFNEQLAQPNIDAIEEIEVLSLGAPAEYGNLTGAVYNVVTRQGTNEFRGDLNFFYQSDSLTDTNTTGEENGGFPFRRDSYEDITFQIGGPIARDRLWFFASYQDQQDGFSDVGIDPDVSTVVVETERLFGKLNLQLGSGHTLVATFHQDEPLTPFGLNPNESPSTESLREGKTPTPGLGYTGVLSDNAVLEVRFGGFFGDVFLGPKDSSQPLGEPRFYSFDPADGDTNITGGHYYWYDLHPERTTVSAKLSYLADDFLNGSHDFRFGVQYNESEAGGVYGYNDLIYKYPGYAYGLTRVPFSYSGNTEAIAFFFDDTWRVNERLTLNVGVRHDENEAFSKAQEELGADLQPTGVVFPRASHYTWEYTSPRFGFNYQLTDDGRTVLKGHFGRYHRAIATGEFANVVGPSIKPIFAGEYDLATGTFPDPFQITDNANLLIDPNYDSPRTDQFIVSFERQIGRDIGLNVNLVKKRGRDFAAWQDLGGIYDTVLYIDDQGADATGNAIELQRLLTDPSDLSFIITNRDEMDFDIEAASVGVVKRMSNNWSLNASLTYLESSGRTTDSVGGSSVQQRGGLQFRRFGRNPNDFVNSGGALRGDVPWQFKTQLVYLLPKDFLVAVNLSHRSGANLVRLVRVQGLTNLGRTTILAQERGTSGRLPDATAVDLRLQKDFTLRGDTRLGLIVDVFNLLNDDANETVVSSFGTSGAFNLPDSFVLPRRVMLGAKLRF